MNEGLDFVWGEERGGGWGWGGGGGAGVRLRCRVSVLGDYISFSYTSEILYVDACAVIFLSLFFFFFFFFLFVVFVVSFIVIYRLHSGSGLKADQCLTIPHQRRHFDKKFRTVQISSEIIISSERGRVAWGAGGGGGEGVKSVTAIQQLKSGLRPLLLPPHSGSWKPRPARRWGFLKEL